jgi:hypothetical protein
MLRLTILLTILLLFLVGLVSALLGPLPGVLFSLPAFLAAMATFLVLGTQWNRGQPFFKAGGLSAPFPGLRRIRPALLASLLGCVAAWVASMAVLATYGGTGAGNTTRPVFARRAEYILNDHGVETEVSRRRFVIVGSSFMIAWHAGGIGFTLIQLHLVLFGTLPPGFPGPAQEWKIDRGDS